jgi:DnaJ-class molecular chaperone
MKHRKLSEKLRMAIAKDIEELDAKSSKQPELAVEEPEKKSTTECDVCHGTGLDGDALCTPCHGSGTV